jgi:hypothetical protein
MQTFWHCPSNSKALYKCRLQAIDEKNKMGRQSHQIPPNFKMYNEYVTQEFTIRFIDPQKRIGLGRDLMIWPDGSNFTVQDIIQNLQYLKPVSALQKKYDYDNLLYMLSEKDSCGKRKSWWILSKNALWNR